MGDCPFCEGPVPEETLMYGGSCPRCFGEIPGEEAATDPGEEVRAMQDASDNRRMLLKSLIPLLLVLPLVGVLALLAIGFVWWNRNPTIEPMVFDDIEEFDYAIVAAPVPDEQPKAMDQAASGQAVAAANTRRPSGTTQRVDDMGVPIVSAPAPKTGGLSFDGFDVQAGRTGEVLSDPGQIRQMIQQRMRGYGRQLKLCYDKRLKVRPELEGRWTGYFTVTETGFPDRVRFRGVEMQDAELEACLTETVRRWKFSRISQPQPVEKNWRFRR